MPRRALIIALDVKRGKDGTISFTDDKRRRIVPRYRKVAERNDDLAEKAGNPTGVWRDMTQEGRTCMVRPSLASIIP